MSLPARAERSAEISAKIGAFIDTAVLEHLTDGKALPSIAQIERTLTDIVTVGVRVVLDDIDDTRPEPDPAVVARRTAVIVAAMLVIVRRQFREAAQHRRRIAATDDDVVPVAGAVGVAAFAARIVARMRERRQRVTLDAAQVRRIAAAAKVPMTPRAEGKLRMIVRTELAVARNRLGADIAASSGRVLYITDGGPCNFDCEQFRNRFATPDWVRRNPVAHPNCVREARPATLGPGDRITLL